MLQVYMQESICFAGEICSKSPAEMRDKGNLAEETTKDVTLTFTVVTNINLLYFLPPHCSQHYTFKVGY